MPITSRPPRPTSATRLFGRCASRVGATLLALAVASCGGDNNDVAVGTPPPSSVTSTSAAIVGSVKGDSTSNALPLLRTEVQLVPGTRYQVGPELQSDIRITLSSTMAATSYVERGFLGVAADQMGEEPLITLIVVKAGAKAIRPLSVDATMQISPEDMSKLVEPIPADFLSWFTARAYVKAGAIGRSDLGGHPARRVEYSIVDVPGSLPCGNRSVGCLWSVNMGDTSLVHVPGDVGYLYEVDVDGERLLVDVTKRNGAADLAASMRFNP